jgi:SAM-dependent methyltransferase
MTEIELHPTTCAICGTTGNAKELYAANFDPQSFNPTIFSARRLPDRIHYRMVACNGCGLVRSDPVIEPEVLATLYAQSSFDYGGEVASLQRTYGRYLKRLEKQGVKKGSLLEIGCGNGFFLEEALRHGYEQVHGVEPSVEACQKAAPAIQPLIVCDIMRPGLFEDERFDVICLFQVFDHLPYPAELLETCFAALKPGGMLLVLNHNVEAVSARLLKEKSPIIDLEHTYLYSPETLKKIVSQRGFEVQEQGGVLNHYPLQYLARLVPLPAKMKRLTLNFLRRSGWGRLPLSVPLGNLYLIAKKPVRTR